MFGLFQCISTSCLCLYPQDKHDRPHYDVNIQEYLLQNYPGINIKTHAVIALHSLQLSLKRVTPQDDLRNPLPIVLFARGVCAGSGWQSTRLPGETLVSSEKAACHAHPHVMNSIL